MADKRVTVTLEAVDNASKKIENVGKSIEKLGKSGDSFSGSLGKIESKIKGFTSGLGSMKGKISAAVTALTTLVTGFAKLYTASKQNFVEGLSKIINIAGSVVNALAGIGRAFVNVLSNVTGLDFSLGGFVKTAVNYEQAIERIKVKSGETGWVIGDLETIIQDLTERTVYSSGEIAAAAENMVQNGRSVYEVIAELPSVTMLATAGNISLARSGEIVASVMNMFRSQGISAAEVAGILAKAANTSGASVESMARSLENCGPQAARLNIPLTQVAAALAIMGDSAIKSGKAGTALKNLFQRMSAPPKAAKQAIKDFDLELAQSKICAGDLTGGLIELKKAFEAHNLEGAKAGAVAKDLFGSYADAGVGALLNSTETEIRAVAKAMEDGRVNTDELAKSVEGLMNTTEGKMYLLSAALEGYAISLKEKVGGALNTALDHVVTFVDTLKDKGPAAAFKWVADETAIHLDDMRQSIMDAFKNIESFFSNGGVFDNMLRAGTNVIKALCDGVREASENGTLQNIMDNVIQKVCSFINNNFPDLIDAGTKIIDAFIQGIENNKGDVETAIGNVIDMINFGSSIQGKIESVMGQFAGTMIDKLCEKIVEKIRNSKSLVANAILDLFELGTGDGDLGMDPTNKGLGNGDKKKTGLNQSGPKDGGWLTDLLKKAGFISESYAAEVEGTLDEKKPFSAAAQRDLQNASNKMNQYGMEHGGYYIDSVDGSLRDGGGRVIATADEIANTSASDIQAALESMDVGQLQALGIAMTDLGTRTTETAAVMGTAFTSMTDSARTNFLNLANICRNQMVNVTNIVRNQMTNINTSIRDGATTMASSFRVGFVAISNIVRSQMVNTTNSIRTYMVNGCNIIRNQCLNMTNICRNQFKNMNDVVRTHMVNISNIISNQTPKWAQAITNGGNSAAAALRVSFAKMAVNAAQGMARVLSTVQSYMNQIAAACNKNLTINVSVNKTVSTTIKPPTTAPSAVIPSTFSLAGTKATAGTEIGLGTLIGSVSAAAKKGQVVNIEVPLYLEGREIARASAKYMDGELSRVNTRTDRKRGVK